MEQALIDSAESGCVEEVSALLKEHPGLNVNWREDRHGWTALHHASHNGHSEVVKLLLAHPAIMVKLVAPPPFCLVA